MGSTTVQAPAPIDPAKVGADSLATQLRLAPDVYAAESTYRPQYAALDQRILADSLLGTNGAPGLLNLYGTASQQLGQQQIDANTQQRQADIADVSRLGSQARQAYLSANPELAASMMGLQQHVGDARNWTPREITPNWAGAGNLTATRAEASSLNPELMRQAQADLASGGKLTTSELADAQQGARAAFAARGLNDSNAAINAEILQTDAARTAKLDRARQFAGGLDASGTALNQANAATANQFALSQFQTNADLARSNSALSLQAQMANADQSRAAMNDQFAREFQLGSMLQGQAQDPFQMVLGRSGATGQAQGAASAAGYTQNSGARMFDPFNSGIMSIYAGNQANQLAANTATANNRSNMFGSLVGAAANIGGAKISVMCLPEGQTIDTPRGKMPVEKLRAGHEVIGYDGQIVRVMQKHEYAERPEVERFLHIRFVASDGTAHFLRLCDRHRIEDRPAGELRVGDKIGGHRITDIVHFGGVSRSYDLLTEDAGYRIHGVPVNSMINELVALAAKLATAN